MMLSVFTVYDKAIGAYLQPFFCRARGEAVRSFSEACNNKENLFNRHGADYHLVYLGEFDDKAGLFSTSEPVRVISALECVVDDEPLSRRRMDDRLPM